jgi:tRNA U34 5-methylaminomethyl-2-thiouridine-forming methyltransferase MnmC
LGDSCITILDWQLSAHMESRIITTRDGSRSVFSDRFQQHYHNIAGALTESRNVFFDNIGLTRALSEHRDITLVEVGFGTGLHVALLECMRKRTGSRSQVHYYSVEKFPLAGDVVSGMGFGRIGPGLDKVVGDIAGELHRARDGISVCVTLTRDQEPVEQPGEAPRKHVSTGGEREEVEDVSVDETVGMKVAGLLGECKDRPYVEHTAPDNDPPPQGMPYTRVEVYRGDFHDWDLSVLNRKADFILHDAFSPDANPDLWTVSTFRKLLQAAGPQAMLGTYCSATKARAAMLLAGWHVGRVPGPPGKREVTVASPDEAMLRDFKRVNEALLMDRFREEL